LTKNKASAKTKKPAKEQYGTTTIAINVEIAEALNQLKRGRDSYSDVLKRFIDNQADVWVDFILIDNELPQLHTVVIQLGEQKESLYYFDGQNIKKYSLEEANALMKKVRQK
jgi:hypothetical protein